MEFIKKLLVRFLAGLVAIGLLLSPVFCPMAAYFLGVVLVIFIVTLFGMLILGDF